MKVGDTGGYLGDCCFTVHRRLIHVAMVTAGELVTAGVEERLDTQAIKWPLWSARAALPGQVELLVFAAVGFLCILLITMLNN